jgi:hypothetical protein
MAGKTSWLACDGNWGIAAYRAVSRQKNNSLARRHRFYANRFLLRSCQTNTQNLHGRRIDPNHFYSELDICSLKVYKNNLSMLNIFLTGIEIKTPIQSGVINI